MTLFTATLPPHGKNKGSNYNRKENEANIRESTFPHNTKHGNNAILYIFKKKE